MNRITVDDTKMVESNMLICIFCGSEMVRCLDRSTCSCGACHYHTHRPLLQAAEYVTHRIRYIGFAESHTPIIENAEAIASELDLQSSNIEIILVPEYDVWGRIYYGNIHKIYLLIRDIQKMIITLAHEMRHIWQWKIGFSHDCDKKYNSRAIEIDARQWSKARIAVC